MPYQSLAMVPFGCARVCGPSDLPASMLRTGAMIFSGASAGVAGKLGEKQPPVGVLVFSKYPATSKSGFDIIARATLLSMATGRREALTKHPSRPGIPKAPTATTIRLDPKLKVRLDGLRRLVKRPVNQLVNEAVARFIDQRAAEVGAELERAIERVKALRSQDPNFEGAIAQFVDAEATLGRHDPVEGDVTTSTAGPAERIVQELLRG